ncbi:MAG: HNH endonuclease [Planctomycetes bacterium]|nr:HNH endonuclease [Planctomycetota bacterium]
MSATDRTKRVLAFRSGGICALPGCHVQLTIEQSSVGDIESIGEAAHIAGENPGAERYDKSMSDAERDHVSNLIYLCPTCHTKIDKKGGAHEYPTTNLLDVKQAHEAKVLKALLAEFRTVTFVELEIATKWLIENQPSTPTSDMTLTSPDAKIVKNKLTDGSRMVIRQGIALAGEVSAFIESFSMNDSTFAERLKAGFLQEYYRLVQEGVTGDERFDSMCTFATHGMTTAGQRAAAIAVLVYLFERCEVFDK